MKYGFVMPSFSSLKDIVAAGKAAEEAGWDGFFVAEAVWGYDAWVILSAVAAQTRRIRLGTLLSPLSRMRPWKLASEAYTLDLLSDGRTILAVGLGALDTGFAAFGEATDRKERAILLDEGLDIITKLWSRERFVYEGTRYRVASVETFQPTEPLVQQPRIPIWVVGAWPRPRSMARAMNYDGLLPTVATEQGWGIASPTDLREIAAFVAEHRTATTPFDIIAEGVSPIGDRAGVAAAIGPGEAAGATWWIESRWDSSRDEVWARLQEGPQHC